MKLPVKNSKAKSFMSREYLPKPLCPLIIILSSLSSLNTHGFIGVDSVENPSHFEPQIPFKPDSLSVSPSGTAISVLGQTFVFEDAFLFKILWEIGNNAVTAAMFVALPYAYAAAAGSIAQKVPNHVASKLQTSVNAVTYTMGAGAMVSTAYALLPPLYDHINSVVDAERSRKRCDKRHGVMPIFQDSPWLAEHLLMKIEFDSNATATLIIDHLKNPESRIDGDDFDTDDLNGTASTMSEKPEGFTISHWQKLESAMAAARVDKIELSIRPSDDGRVMAIRSTSEGITTTKVLPLKSDVPWDLEIMQDYCPKYEAEHIGSVFHPEIITTLSNILDPHSYDSPETSELFFKAHGDASVYTESAERIAAVIDLEQGGQLVQSDQSSLLTPSVGFLILTDHRQDKQSLLAGAQSSIFAQGMALMHSRQVVVPKYIINSVLMLSKLALNAYSLGQLRKLITSITRPTVIQSGRGVDPLAVKDAFTLMSLHSAVNTVPESTSLEVLADPDTTFVGNIMQGYGQLQAYARTFLPAADSIIHPYSPSVLHKGTNFFAILRPVVSAQMLPHLDSARYKAKREKKKASENTLTTVTSFVPNYEAPSIGSTAEAIASMHEFHINSLFDKVSFHALDMIDLYNNSGLSLVIDPSVFLNWNTLMEVHNFTDLRRLDLTEAEKKHLITAIYFYNDNLPKNLETTNKALSRIIKKELTAINNNLPSNKVIQLTNERAEFHLFQLVTLLEGNIISSISTTPALLKKSTVNTRYICDKALNLVMALITPYVDGEPNVRDALISDTRITAASVYLLADYYQKAVDIGKSYELAEAKSKAVASLVLIYIDTLAPMLRDMGFDFEEGEDKVEIVSETAIRGQFINILRPIWKMYSASLISAGQRLSTHNLLAQLAIYGFKENIFYESIKNELGQTPGMQQALGHPPFGYQMPGQMPGLCQQVVPGMYYPPQGYGQPPAQPGYPYTPPQVSGHLLQHPTTVPMTTAAPAVAQSMAALSIEVTDKFASKELQFQQFIKHLQSIVEVLYAKGQDGRSEIEKFLTSDLLVAHTKKIVKAFEDQVIPLSDACEEKGLTVFSEDYSNKMLSPSDKAHTLLRKIKDKIFMNAKRFEPFMLAIHGDSNLEDIEEILMNGFLATYPLPTLMDSHSAPAAATPIVQPPATQPASRSAQYQPAQYQPARPRPQPFEAEASGVAPSTSDDGIDKHALLTVIRPKLVLMLKSCDTGLQTDLGINKLVTNATLDTVRNYKTIHGPEAKSNMLVDDILDAVKKRPSNYDVLMKLFRGNPHCKEDIEDFIEDGIKKLKKTPLTTPAVSQPQPHYPQQPNMQATMGYPRFPVYGQPAPVPHPFSQPHLFSQSHPFPQSHPSHPYSYGGNYQQPPQGQGQWPPKH